MVKTIDKGHRDSNIELLRLILMAMIVFWHFIVHGMLNVNSGISSVSSIGYTGLVCMSFLSIHVDCFIFISGYYGIKFSVKKVCLLLFQTSFYSVLIFIIVRLSTMGTHWYQGLTMAGLFDVFFPLGANNYWFITDYFYLMLLAPLINLGIIHIPQSQTKSILLLLAIFIVSISPFMSSQYNHFGLFVFMYILGRYCGLYHREKMFVKISPVLLWLIGVSISATIVLVLHYLKILSVGGLFHWMPYNSPFVIISAVAFFYVFNRLHISYSPIINWLAQGVLGVYLLTEHPNFSQIFNSFMVDSAHYQWLVLPIFAVIVVVVASSVDHLRQIAFTSVETLWSSRIIQNNDKYRRK